MNQFSVNCGGSTTSFDTQTGLISYLETLLGRAEVLEILMPNTARAAAREIVALLERNRIEVVLSADSDPETTDYVAQTLLGGAGGGILGAVGGVQILTLLARLGLTMPGPGWFLAAAVALGAAAGAAMGFGLTRMGLRVQFVSADTLRVELVPG